MRNALLANLALLLHSGTMFAIGTLLCVLTFVNDWSAWVYFFAGLLAFAGGGMLFGRLFKGLRYLRFECPACGEGQVFASNQVKDGMLYPCKKCFLYLRTEADSPVAVEHACVHGEAVFEAPLPEHMVWDDGCMGCGGAATRNVEVSGTTSVYKNRQTVYTTRRISVPVCEAHAHENIVAIGPASHFVGNAGFGIRFRSYAAMLRFREKNPAALKVEGTLTF